MAYRIPPETNETTLQFKLRRGVKLHNGEPFNAEAVKFSVDRTRNPEQRAPLRSLMAPIKEVQIVDEYTVNVTSEKPDPLLVGRLSGYATNILPPRYVREKGDAHIANNPLGTGPYKFVSWVKGGDLTLEANPDYWRRAPRIKRVIIRTIPEPASRVAAVKTGEADIITTVPPGEIEGIKRSGKAQVQTVRSGRLMHVMICDAAAPLQDGATHHLLRCGEPLPLPAHGHLRGEQPRGMEAAPGRADLAVLRFAQVGGQAIAEPTLT